MPLLKNGFLEKIETWHVGLSCQYTHFMSFSSKSEHDTIADQATLKISICDAIKQNEYEVKKYNWVLAFSIRVLYFLLGYCLVMHRSHRQVLIRRRLMPNRFRIGGCRKTPLCRLLAPIICSSKDTFV